MLDNQDITLLKGMFGTMLSENNEILRKDLKREIRDEVQALIIASEKRVEKRIVTQVAELLDATVLPQIAELQLKIA